MSFKSRLLSARSIFAEDGFVPLVAATTEFLQRKFWLIKRDHRHKILCRLYDLLKPRRVTYEIKDISAEFDFGFVTPRRDFRNDSRNERSILRSSITDLEKEDVFYDIGPSVGVYSAFAGQIIGSEDTIVAIEPQPVAVQYLTNNLEINCMNFTVLSMAVSDEAGYGTVPSTHSSSADISGTNGITVRKDSMDRIVTESNLRRPTVAKVDVEGMELKVLQGLGSLLDDLELLYVEVHTVKGKKFGSNVEVIVDLLSEHFGSVVRLGERGDQVHLKASDRYF